MSVRQEVRALSALAAPVVISQLANMAMGVEDLWFIGRLGAEPMAAVAAGNTYAFGLLIIGIGLMAAMDPLSAQATGAGRPRAGWDSLQRALVVAAAASIPFMAAFAFGGPVLRALGQPPEIIPAAEAFLIAQIPSLFPFMAYFAFRSWLQGRNLVRPAMWSALAANVVNIAANAWWVLGEGLGPAGSGMATATARCFQCATLFYVVWRQARRDGFVFDLVGAARDVAGLRRFLSLGLPLGIQHGLEAWIFVGATFVAGTLGTAALAGHQIALNLASLSFMVPLGLASATSVRVGQAIGRADVAGAQRAAKVGTGLGLVAMSCSAVGFAAVPELLAGFYTPDPNAIAIAVTLLPIAAAFQLFDGAQVVGAGILRGAADARVPLLINLAGFWGVGLPVGWWLAVDAGRGVSGLWWGLTAGLAAVAILLYARVVWRLREGRVRAVVA